MKHFTLLSAGILTLGMVLTGCSCGREEADNLRQAPGFESLETALDKYTAEYIRNTPSEDTDFDATLFDKAGRIATTGCIVSEAGRVPIGAAATVSVASRLIESPAERDAVRVYSEKLATDSAYMAALMQEATGNTPAESGSFQKLLLIKALSRYDLNDVSAACRAVGEAYESLTGKKPNEVYELDTDSLDTNSMMAAISTGRTDIVLLQLYLGDCVYIKSAQSLPDFNKGYIEQVYASKLEGRYKARMRELIEFITPNVIYWYDCQMLAKPKRMPLEYLYRR